MSTRSILLRSSGSRRIQVALCATIAIGVLATSTSVLAVGEIRRLPPAPKFEPIALAQLPANAVAGPQTEELPLWAEPEQTSGVSAVEPTWFQEFTAYRQEPWQLLPQGLIYRNYLAGVKQSRLGSVMHEDFKEGSIWDTTLGCQVGLLRRGNPCACRPTGFQIDIEGSAQLRLDRDTDEELTGTDYRVGVPLSWGTEVYQVRFGYYHISSHVGDEFLVRNPGFERENFVREALIWGHSYYVTPHFRVYGEAGLAFLRDVSEPWEFQFGFDYSPPCDTGFRGAPFAAFNYHIRQELHYNGNVVGQVGWAWRRSPYSGLLRIGLEYYYGRDQQFSFFRNEQHKLGFGTWYDF